MKKSSLKVALLMSKLPVSEKINVANKYNNSVINNATVFVNSNTLTTNITNAIAALELAWKNAQDGGKTKKALMHDKEDALMKLMFDLAHYVEGVANGDEAIVHLAGMQVKTKGTIVKPEFEVFQWNDSGAVGLRVKPHAKALYEWQYSADPVSHTSWVSVITTAIGKATIGDLAVGTMYWFRVVIATPFGKTVVQPINFVVN